VHRILHTQNGTLDCASAVDACHVGAAKLSDYSEGASALVDFDSSIPLPPPPTLLAGPTTRLVEGQSVALFGGAFPANASVSLQQCVTGSTLCSQLRGVQADANGNFIVLVQVHRSVVAPPVFSTDCASAPGACSVVAVALSDRDAQNSVALSFDPTGPPPPGALTVTPHTDLVQYQTVTVAGSGFPPGAGAQILECTSNPASYSDCASYSVGFAPVGANGSFSTSVAVRRVLHLSGGDVDCASAPGACSLFASSYGATPVVAAAALGFDPSAPLPPPPTITVAPDTDLVQGQQVTVTGSNFAPNQPVAVGECVTGFSVQGGCGPGTSAYVVADGTGAFTTPLTAQRGVRDYSSFPPAVLDCASAPQACSVVAFGFEFGDSASAPVDFDPSVPIVLPTVTVTPQFGLADRSFVSVHGNGFTPGDEVVISECDADAASFGPGCSTQGTSAFLIADPSGTVDATLRVHRDLTYYDFSGSGSPIKTANCSDAEGECVIRAESYTNPLATLDVPLGFDPHAVAPPPVITVDPAGPWADGQEVVVHGTGFTPDAPLGLAECIAGVQPSGRTCDSQAGGLYDTFYADANGEFTRTITIRGVFQTVDATVDCATEPNGCALLAANRQDFGLERVEVPIVFGSTVLAARTLAFTGAGASTEPLALAGAGALGLGLALLVVTRKRVRAGTEGGRATS
jgi:Neocarzinostatin family